MSEGSSDDQLSHYLSELYRNLNLINEQLEGALGEPPAEVENEELINAIEGRFSEWMGSFYNILIYLFCTTVAFLTGVVDQDLRFIALTMFAFFPIYLWFTFLYSIPEIKINNEIIFSRKDLTLSKQIQLARSLFTFFLHQLYDNSKRGLVILSGFIVLLAWTVLQEYVIGRY